MTFYIFRLRRKELQLLYRSKAPVFVQFRIQPDKIASTRRKIRRVSADQLVQRDPEDVRYGNDPTNGWARFIPSVDRVSRKPGLHLQRADGNPLLFA